MEEYNDMNTENAGRVVIMNFTNVYKWERFSHDQNYTWLDCTHLEGTECYCDKESAESLKRLMADYPAEAIHFIDSGNYHYLTKFWTDKLQQPFSLVVFDHHPDMQPPLFEGVISCGGWVKDVMDTNPYLRKVILAGVSEKLKEAIPETYRDRVVFYGEHELSHEEAWKRFSSQHVEGPVYLSIDKDVLDAHSAATNWDQGLLSLPELEQLLSVVLHHEQVIGIDICGECSTTLDIFKENQEVALDSRANQELLDFFRRNRPQE